jgi:hypothetical protein
VGDEGLLDFVQGCALCYAFDGLDIGAFGLEYRDEATVDELAIQHDGTGAALPFPAAFFGAGEVQVFAEYVEQAGHRPGFD